MADDAGVNVEHVPCVVVTSHPHTPVVRLAATACDANTACGQTLIYETLSVPLFVSEYIKVMDTEKNGYQRFHGCPSCRPHG